MRTKIFFDMEFTGLRQDTTPISIGLVSENGDSFYGVFTDYDKTQVDDWIQANVLDNLFTPSQPSVAGYIGTVTKYLKLWLQKQGPCEMWSDCLAYDWVLFCELFGGAIRLPEAIYYIPFDISTYLHMQGVDPDVNRKEYSGCTELEEHNALGDAYMIKACYEKLKV